MSYLPVKHMLSFGSCRRFAPSCHVLSIVRHPIGGAQYWLSSLISIPPVRAVSILPVVPPVMTVAIRPSKALSLGRHLEKELWM
ncbi:hypothetical protein MLD52_22520 [Puniceicoccaceae bacterium K14]|nr:hypothetical protein [Puniceicoccaceae bacterium K14]